jgi:hypothetical protein
VDPAAHHRAGPRHRHAAQRLRAAPGRERGAGEHPLHAGTVYAIEFSVAADIPEWGNVEASTGFEAEADFTGGAARWVDGYPKVFYVIR